jgi:hypothetical protein
MGREGFEPSTLGLRVHGALMQQAAATGPHAQPCPFASAGRCSLAPHQETSPYAHLYAQDRERNDLNDQRWR